MKQVKSSLSILMLLMLLAMPAWAQEETVAAPEATQEIVIVEVPAPVVESPATATDGVDAPFVSPDVMLIAGAIVLGIGLGGTFILLLRALDALKVSVPQESLTLMGNQLIEVLVRTRKDLATQVQATPSPVDDMVLAIANVPLDAIYQELRRRTGGDVSVEMKVVAEAENSSS